MRKITVLSPFSLRLDSAQPAREFPVGIHTLSDEEYEHWFLQGCLKEGRAALMADEAEDEGDSGELVAPTKAQLMKLNRDKLVELALVCGVTVPEGAGKEALSDLLLAAHADMEGITLVKGPDGVYVEKAKAE